MFIHRLLPALFSVVIVLFSSCGEAPSKSNTDLNRKWDSKQPKKKAKSAQRVTSEDFFHDENRGNSKSKPKNVSEADESLPEADSTR